jgi:hypothetical protein
MKSERELRKRLYECNEAIQRLDTNSTPLFPKDTRKYWCARRVRTRAYLRGHQRKRDARKARSLDQRGILSLLSNSQH